MTIGAYTAMSNCPGWPRAAYFSRSSIELFYAGDNNWSKNRN